MTMMFVAPGSGPFVLFVCLCVMSGCGAAISLLGTMHVPHTWPVAHTFYAIANFFADFRESLSGTATTELLFVPKERA